MLLSLVSFSAPLFGAACAPECLFLFIFLFWGYTLWLGSLLTAHRDHSWWTQRTIWSDGESTWVGYVQGYKALPDELWPRAFNLSLP